MRARDDERRDALRLILSSCARPRRSCSGRCTTTRSCRCSSASASGGVEAAEAFRAGGREEQAESEERELACSRSSCRSRSPRRSSRTIIDDVIAEVGATSLRDLGRVMADVMPQVAGRADGSAVSQLVREKLA